MNAAETTPTSSKTLELLAWAEVNKKKLLYAVGALFALGLIIYVVIHLKAQKEAEASAALVELNRSFDGNGKLISPDASAYLKLAQEYSGTGAGERALLMAAGGYFSAGRYNEAKTYFDQFAKDYPNSRFNAEAALGSAASLDGNNDLDRALAAYEQVAVNYPNTTVEMQAKLARGVIYEAKNDTGKALKIYEEVERGKGTPLYAAEAKMRKERLLAKITPPKMAVTPMLPPAITPSAPAAAKKAGGTNLTKPAAPVKTP